MVLEQLMDQADFHARLSEQHLISNLNTQFEQHELISKLSGTEISINPSLCR